MVNLKLAASTQQTNNNSLKTHFLDTSVGPTIGYTPKPRNIRFQSNNWFTSFAKRMTKEEEEKVDMGGEPPDDKKPLTPNGAIWAGPESGG